MAEAAVVRVVLGKLADVAAGALLNKFQKLQGVSEQIELMQEELRLIQALLRDADSKRNTSELVAEWLKQVTEIANRIDSAIHTFRDKIEEIEENRAESSESSKCTCFRKIKKNAKRNYKMYKLGLHKELEDITGKLNRILQRRNELGIQVKLEALDDVDDLEPSDNVPDPEVVGFENDKDKIIKQLLNSSISRRTVLSIVGPGGLGKTTLAQKVYKSVKLEGQVDCRAWLTISQKYNLNCLLRKILYSVDPKTKEKVPSIKDEDLELELNSSLRGKRYLIILDDVWDINLWEQFKNALPADPDNASRVIITSRSLDVAKAADRNTQMYKLDYLNDNDSLALLFRTALQRHIQSENYPRDLLEIAKRLTKKCGGLPLALVVLGGILRRRDRIYGAWSKVEDTMDWHDEDGEKCMKILAKSYEDLPDHLKSCFLYFAAFPEDYKISARQVIEMWMAEEFILKARGGTIENRAEKCLEELVKRCLIQVTKKSLNGYSKYCNMHDLLRDLAITKAEEENFFTVFSKQGEDVNQLAEKKPHRAALQLCTLTQDGVYSQNTLSLLCFGFGPYSSDNCGFSKLNYSGFRLLRVLSLERVDLTEFTQPQWPKGLADLRYLGLRDCRLPQDIFEKLSFNNLEIIDLKGSTIDTDKETIDLRDVVMPILRHVYGNGIGTNLQFKWDQHTNLQTIKDVSIPIDLVAELGCCFNLRTLGIRIGHIYKERALKEWQNLKYVLRRTEQLVYLGIRMERGYLPFGGTTDLSCHEKIQRLYLEGVWVRDICVPSVKMFPTNLTKLTLVNSKLKEDPMPILKELLSLRILHLSWTSYVGTELICLTGGFLNLEKLKLIGLKNLCHWNIKEGSMPTLTHLQIYECIKLHTLPELQNVPTLQELFVTASPELRESMQGDVYKIEHITSVTIKRYFWDKEE